MSRQNLAVADSLFYGRAQYNLANNSKRGVPCILPHQMKRQPALASANAIALSQAVLVNASANLNGALGASGVATLDVARNVVAAWTTAAQITVTGTDQYGATVVESSAAGQTAFTGKKAFKTVTNVKITGAGVTGLTVGTGSAIGLSYRVDDGDLLNTRLANAADAGTFVKADTTSPATATTGDVRGTYTPAGAMDGAKFLTLLFKISDASSKIGAFGVDQFAG